MVLSAKFVFIILFLLIITSVPLGISVIYPLAVGLTLLVVNSVHKGFQLKSVLRMVLQGGVKSLIILKIFILIGAIIAVWMAGGTIGWIVYYGIKLINPTYFILSAFLISSLVSFLLGTSFGTIGTIGITLIILARSGNVDINVAAGAIIAGAYFGDRCSPMSSSANLVAAVTDTRLYVNIGNMMRTSIVPFLLTVVAYTGLSIMNPLIIQGEDISNEILKNFDITFWVSLPAIIVLLLVLIRVDVKISMLCSIVAAILVAIIFQHRTILDMAKAIWSGYTMVGESPLRTIIQGGGIQSMIKVAIIVFISSAYSGVFEGTGLLKELDGVIEKISLRHGAFPVTLLAATITSFFGATQTLSIILTHQIVKKTYGNDVSGRERLAVTLENTSVVIAPLVPWNIAGAVPAAALAVGFGYIPYACYLYLLPAFQLLCNIRPVLRAKGQLEKFLDKSHR